MSEDRHKTSSPPQYIVTTPSEADTEEERSMQELERQFQQKQSIQSTTTTTTSRVISQNIQTKQTKRTSRITTMAASTSQSIESALTEGSSIMQSQEQQQQQQHQVFTTQKNSSSSSSVATSSNRSIKSSSMSEEHSGAFMNVGHTLSATSTQLAQQLKAQSSTSITTSGGSIMQKSNSTNIQQQQLQQQQQQCTKSKFQSFLQQPESMGHMTSSGNFLTAHQKHVRQFVRSTSAHSEATAVAAANKEKCLRSASTQHDDVESVLTECVNNNKLGLQQTNSILLSKSAETIEMKSTTTGMRTQLTLSGGFLAPPNRKITILSPIHAPPGLHDMLKRSGRSPLSPRISFPGSEADLFG